MEKYASLFSYFTWWGNFCLGERAGARTEGPHQALVVGANLGMVGVSSEPWEGDELPQTAQETFDSRIRAVTSREHSELVWFARREQQGKKLCDCGTMEKC